MDNWMWFAAAISLLGNVLVVKHRREGFALWIMTNIAWIFYNFTIGAHAQAAMFCAYLGMAIYGWITWTRERTV